MLSLLLLSLLLFLIVKKNKRIQGAEQHHAYRDVVHTLHITDQQGLLKSRFGILEVFDRQKNGKIKSVKGQNMYSRQQFGAVLRQNMAEIRSAIAKIDCQKLFRNKVLFNIFNHGEL